MESEKSRLRRCVRDTYRKCKLVMDTRHDDPTLNVDVRGTIAAESLSSHLSTLIIMARAECAQAAASCLSRNGEGTSPSRRSRP